MKIKPRGLHAAMSLALVGGVALAGACWPTTPAVALNWASNQPRNVKYEVVHEVGLKNGAPEFVENEQLGLDFNGNAQVTIDQNGESFGPLAVSPGGQLAINRSDLPHYETFLLMSLLPRNGVQARVGDSWETVFPPDAYLVSEPDQLSFQDRYRVTVRAVRNVQGTQLVDLSVRIDSRIVKNQLYQTMEAALNGSAKTTLQKFSNFYPAGTAEVSFNASEHRVQQGELYVLLQPRVGIAHTAIQSSEHRRHITLKAL